MTCDQCGKQPCESPWRCASERAWNTSWRETARALNAERQQQQNLQPKPPPQTNPLRPPAAPSADGYCDTCGTTPCTNPSFCAACRKADAERQPITITALPENWDSMALGTLWQKLNDPRRFGVAKSTLDTAEHLIRSSNLARLKRWLKGCSDTELKAIETHLRKVTKP